MVVEVEGTEVGGIRTQGDTETTVVLLPPEEEEEEMMLRQ